MVVNLGFDLNCFTNRYVEPEAWTDLVAACGVRVVQFNFDLIDFTLPWKIQERLAERTRALCARAAHPDQMRVRRTQPPPELPGAPR